ncbi:MAG TPA: S41 family peptidase [Cellvibrionaceae bacterium]
MRSVNIREVTIACRLVASLVLACIALSACNKTGSTSRLVDAGSNSNLTWVEGEYPAYGQYLDRCAAPRTGIDPATGKPYDDKSGSAAHEKFALRGYSHETYLWAKELTDQNPTSALNPLEYFDLLKTAEDRFHFYVSSEDNYRDFILGKPLGYGITWLRQHNNDVVVGYVERNSPAEAAGIVRGDLLVTTDGLSEAQMSLGQFNDALFPTANSPSHRFVFKNNLGSLTPERQLTAVELTVNSVQNISYFSGSDGRKIAYFSFGSFNGTAEKELINAANEINRAGAQELIVDIRFNGGGYLGVAAQLAYIVGGDAISDKRIFSSLRFGPNLPAGSFGNSKTPFLRTTQGYSRDIPTGQPLPKLNLKRLYVLTSDHTCSASESLINGLRGVDFPVVQIGSTTCGKPFGMVPLSNCGYEYYTINFRYENEKGFSAFEQGIAPRNAEQAQGSPLGCELHDEFSQPLGNANEGLLAAALNHIDTGACASTSLAAPRRLQNPINHPNPVFSNAIVPRLAF